MNSKYFVLFPLFVFMLLAASESSAQSTKISLPLNRAVYQRNLASTATVPVALQFKNSLAGKFTYTINKIDVKTGNSPSPHSIFTGSIPQNGLFQTSVTLPAGWYTLEVKVYKRDDEALIETVSMRFGVGEVIFSAGQSNIQGTELGTSGPPVLTGNAYDGLSVINQNCFCKRDFPFPVFEKMERGNDDTQKKIAPNGNQNLWCYEVLGRALSDQSGGIPIAFFNAGATGTSIANWSESADNPAAITASPWTINCNTDVAAWGSEGAEGQPYHALKTALNFYGAMFGARTVLWHQGESDNFISTSKENYGAGLANVINRSRQHFHSSLGWSISRVAYFAGSPNHNPVIEAQETVKNTLPNTSWGAYYSDKFTGANQYRQSDDQHFNQNGLLALGSQIAKGGFGAYSTPPGYVDITSLAPVQALPAPAISAYEYNGAYTLSVEGNYQSYCWVENNGPIKNCRYSTKSITTTGGNWRCYVTHLDASPANGHEKRNIGITRTVELPLTYFGTSLDMKENTSFLD